MKKTIVFLLVVTTFLSCTKTNETSKENIALVEQYIQAVENLNSDGMDNLLADNYMGYGPSHNNKINQRRCH